MEWAVRPIGVLPPSRSGVDQLIPEGREQETFDRFAEPQHRCTEARASARPSPVLRRLQELVMKSAETISGPNSRRRCQRLTKLANSGKLWT